MNLDVAEVVGGSNPSIRSVFIYVGTHALIELLITAGKRWQQEKIRNMNRFLCSSLYFCYPVTF